MLEVHSHHLHYMAYIAQTTWNNTRRKKLGHS